MRQLKTFVHEDGYFWQILKFQRRTGDFAGVFGAGTVSALASNFGRITSMETVPPHDR